MKIFLLDEHVLLWIWANKSHKFRAGSGSSIITLIQQFVFLVYIYTVQSAILFA